MTPNQLFERPPLNANVMRIKNPLTEKESIYENYKTPRKGITCSYDKLKDRVQASASDMNMIFALNGNESRTIQFTYNNVAREHEKVEVVHGVISIEQAEKIASLEYKNVTIRFYGKNGYKDAPLPRAHKLINIVNLVKSV